MKEYLATLYDTAWGAASGLSRSSFRRPILRPVDRSCKGPGFFVNSDNYLIDVEFGVIVDVEASRSIRQAEVGAARTMIERTEERFGLKPERLVGDTAYGAAPMLNWLVEERASATYPRVRQSKRDDGTFSAATFDMIRPTTSTTARAGSSSERAAPCTRARRFCIVRASSTAMYARLNRSAVQKIHRARSRATSMNTPKTLPGRLLTPKTLRSHDVSARRSR